MPRVLGSALGLPLGALLLLAQAPAPAPEPPAPPATAPAPSGQPARQPAAPATPASPPAPDRRDATASRLPADRSTRHELSLPGRTLRFTATAGSFRLLGEDGAPQADHAWLGYVLDPPAGPPTDPPTGTERAQPPAARPVAFLVNGGPGAASAWLQFGAAGPWRVAMEAGPLGGALSPSAPPLLLPNTETWLDFADLVFLDPPGTGWSRTLSEEGRRRAWSVGGDISVLAEAARRWLDANGRRASPVLVVGESYGGFRGPLLVRALQSEQAVGVSGLLLVSPVLDFGGRAGSYDPMPFVLRLPSMVAAARGTADRAALADAEEYAMGDLLRDLWRGEGDRDAVERISRRVAELLPGIDPALIRRRAGRLDIGTFLRELRRGEGRLVSPYDAGIGSADPFPAAAYSDAPDPVLAPLRTLLTGAASVLYRDRLGWLPEGRYELLNDRVNRAWDWGRGRTAPESYDALRRALALDPRLHVLVVHGAADLVTPYMASKVLLDQTPPLGPPGRLALRVYPGGHMFYSETEGREGFRRDAEALARAAATPPPGAAAAGTPPPPGRPRP